MTLQITEGVFDLARAGQADMVIAHYGHQGTQAFHGRGTRPLAKDGLCKQRGAYTLWGLVPFVRLVEQRRLQGRPLGMDALVVDDPLFPRIMVSIVVNPARVAGIDEAGARGFERFLIDPSTQALIRGFRHNGLIQQTWWPAGRNNAGVELGF